MACSSAGAWRPERFMDCKGQNQYQGIFLPVFPELLNPSPDAFLLLLISPGLCFQIPDKQYVLTALAARAKLRAWHDVDALFTTKVGALGLSALWWRCRLAIPHLLGFLGFTPPGTLSFQLLVDIFPSTFYFPKFQT